MRVKFLNPGFWILASVFVLTACGKPKSEADPDSLRVLVQIPAGEEAGLFWFGVARKELEVRRGAEKEVFAWQPGTAIETKLNEGDQLIFRAFDDESRMLVYGESGVGEAKIVSIPVRRVL